MMQFYLTSHQFEDFKRFFRESVEAGRIRDLFRVELGGVGDTGVQFLAGRALSVPSERHGVLQVDGLGFRKS